MAAANGGAFSKASYDEVWRWSTTELDRFWSEVADWAGVEWVTRPSKFFAGDLSAGAGPRQAGEWCPGGTLNYATQALGGHDGPAIVARSQTRGPIELTRSELAVQVRRARAGLIRAGVGRGDRVAGYLPNVPEAIVAFLAAASLGAVWTSCPPEMGARGVLDRLVQVEPKVLFVVDGYRYGDRVIDRTAESAAVVEGLPTLSRVVQLPYLFASPETPSGWWSWDRLCAEEDHGAFEAVDFDHPLYILYSSGTTGKPKAIVHGHGGMVLEHIKYLAFHHDLGTNDRFFWFTTTGWMMWNLLVGGLLVGSAVVLFDGDPSKPGPEAMWEIISSTGSTVAGMGAGFYVAGEKAGINPAKVADLTHLRGAGSTGSPLPAAAASWWAERVPDAPLASMSGGTDVCTAFVGWSPLHSVRAGEISCRCLGAAVSVLSDDAKPIVDQEGELVLTAPLPSMPVGFWGDKDGKRYRSAYFDRWPGSGIWAHGDRATLTSRGGLVITGRSDGTLNRGGVRMGTAEFYALVEEREDVADSLVVHVDDPDGGPGVLWLFVVPAANASLDSEMVSSLQRALRRGLSPRHVPDRIEAVRGVPRTFSGKKLEVPVKRLLMGRPLQSAVSVEAVANPETLSDYQGFVAS